MITVRELIEALQRIDNPNMPVYVTEATNYSQQRHYKDLNRVSIEVDTHKGARILLEGHAPFLYEQLDRPSISKSHEHHETILSKGA